MAGGREEGQGGRYIERNICITMCQIDSQWELAIGFRELKPGLHDSLEE